MYRICAQNVIPQIFVNINYSYNFITKTIRKKFRTKKHNFIKKNTKIVRVVWNLASISEGRKIVSSHDPLR